MDKDKPTQEQVFRDGAEAAVAIARSLEPHCKDVGDFIKVLSLALESDGQLSLLMEQVKRGQRK